MRRSCCSVCLNSALAERALFCNGKSLFSLLQR
jgi:hypothetical protein